MSQSRPAFSAQRRARLETWAGLWLLRLAACLAQIAPALLPPLAPIRKLLLNLLIARVAEMISPPQRTMRRPQARIKSNRRRAMIGVRVRQLLRAPTLGERITKLLDLLRDFEAHTQRLCKRLARGLTRLRPVLIAPMAAEALADGVLAHAQTFDSS